MANSKIFTIFAGINGAGKSTLYYTLGADKFGVRLNSDEVVKSNGQDWRNPRAQIEAARRILSLQDECLNKGLSFNRETTVPGHSIMRVIKKAKSLGYKINLDYVGVESLDIAKKRVAERVRHGGHGISEETIDFRFSRINSALLEIFPHCDSIKIYDNSGSGIELVSFSKKNTFIKIKECKWANDLLNEYEKTKQNLGFGSN